VPQAVGHGPSILSERSDAGAHRSAQEHLIAGEVLLDVPAAKDDECRELVVLYDEKGDLARIVSRPMR